MVLAILINLHVNYLKMHANDMEMIIIHIGCGSVIFQILIALKNAKTFKYLIKVFLVIFY